MQKLYSSWVILILIVVVVALYHLYALTEKYYDSNNNIIGPYTDQNVVIPGTLTATSKFNNKIGNSSFPDSNGDIHLIPVTGKGVFIGANNSRTRLRGRVLLGSEASSDNTDSYYLQKITNGVDNSALRLTINDNNDESFEIWGGSCATGSCGGDGTKKHAFIADGTAMHTNQVCINNTCLTEDDFVKIKRKL